MIEALSRRPAPADTVPYFRAYIDLVPEGDVLAQLERQARETHALLVGREGARVVTPYAPGKWSLAQVLGHVVDGERVFCYRALTAARGDASALPGFDQDGWAATAGPVVRPFGALLEEFLAVRAATVALFAGLDEAALARRGTANGNAFTVRAIPWLIAGHELHHRAVIARLYP